MKKNINKLFSNLCCSSCKADFTDESITVLREEDEFSVLQIVCNNCKKSFGIAFMGQDNFSVKNPSDADLAFELQDGPDAVSMDDVIDAHRFIKGLGADWKKHLPKEYRDKTK